MPEVHQRLKRNREEEQAQELTLDVVKEKGMENFSEEEIFSLCSRTIRENNYESDDFLTYICFELFYAGSTTRLSSPIWRIITAALHRI